jgi:RHS repeat-associated protein
VSYTYDYTARQKTMTTYGAETSITAWNYYSGTGLLASKRYNSDLTGTTGDGPEYTYTPGGRLETRTWERGVVTTYGYDGGGRLETVAYTYETIGQTTPNVVYNYDALGRLKTITQTNQSKITYAYDPLSLSLDSETIQYDLDHNGSYEFTRVLNRWNDDPHGRNSGYELLDEDGIPEAEANYGYDPLTGRLETVDDGGLDPCYYANNYFSYSYVDQSTSNLIETITGGMNTVTNTWDPYRDILDLKENKTGNYNNSIYDYSVNDLGQRYQVDVSGGAFGYGLNRSERDRTWGYDLMGQLTFEKDANNNAYDRGFAYDGIGNRTASIAGDTNPAASGATTYTPNALNQYSAITDPASSLSTPQYDDDGNVESSSIRPTGLPSAGLQTAEYEWDAENRLVKIKQPDDTVIATYLYDALGRRIHSTHGYHSTTWVYDGWNPIVRYFGQYPSEVYLWGLDLSGSLQGAGGVGGLLAVSLSGLDTFYPTYDGNGNVSECIATNGGIDVHFEYDAFGNVINSSGWFAPYFSFRFSTKQQDAESGLLYYGYRYYDPVTGRWPSRDPIEEEGGINLYGFVGNNGINQCDYLGMKVSVKDNPGSGFGVRLTSVGLDRFVSDLKEKYKDKKFCVTIYHQLYDNKAHTSGQILEAASKHANDDKVKEVVLLLHTHGKIPNVNAPAIVSGSNRGHFLVLDSDVNTNQFRNNIESSGGPKSSFYVAACYVNPHFINKNGNTYINTMSYSNLNASERSRWDTTNIYYKDTPVGEYEQIWNNGVDHQLSRLEDKNVKVIICIFIGRSM